MSTPPNEPPPQPPPATHLAGQQAAPSTPVPAATALSTVPQTNTMAVVSLVTGIASFFGHIIPFVGGFTLAVVAIITGFMARGQIKRTGEQGMPLAVVGIVIGFVHLALIGLVVIFFFGFVLAVFGAIMAGGSTSR